MGTWRKSSYSSAQGGTCIEVAAAPTAILIRDTKQEPLGNARTVLRVTPEAWTSFAVLLK